MTIITMDDRRDASKQLSRAAAIAKRSGRHAKATELLEAAMLVHPTSESIRAWLGARMLGAEGVERAALQEVASWF